MHEGLSPPVESAPRGLMRAGLITGGVAVLVVATGLFIRAHDETTASSTATAQATPSVHLIKPSTAGSAQALTLPGTLAAWTEARIFARVPGYVRTWNYDIGARVGAGTPLGTIDTPELDQQIIQARAALARARAEASLARTTAARWNNLLTSASVSQQEADEKNGDDATHTAAVNEAEAALGRYLAMKSYATVRAPFGGVVTLRNADIGDLVGPGATTQVPLFGMADEHRIRVYVNVPQQYSASMIPGVTATLTVPEYPGHPFAAEVTGASGAIDIRNGALQVELTTDNTQGLLRTGGYAQVRFKMPGTTGVVVPATALVLRGDGSKIAVVNGQGHIHLLPVVIGRDMGSSVEITAGLAPGVRIVDNPPDSITEGETVRVEGGHD